MRDFIIPMSTGKPFLIEESNNSNSGVYYTNINKAQKKLIKAKNYWKNNISFGAKNSDFIDQHIYIKEIDLSKGERIECL